MARFSLGSFRKKYGRYILVGSIVFFIGLVVHFPVQRLAPLITQAIEKNSGYQISASEMSIGLPLGISMKDVHVQGPPIMNTPVNHHFESLKVYPSVMSLLTYLTKKSLGINFKAIRGKERWSGTMAYGPKFTDVAVKGKGLDYSIIQPLGQYNQMLAGQSLTLSSKFSFDFKLSSPTPELEKGDLTKADGFFKLNSKETSLETVMTGKLDFTDTSVNSKLVKGKLNVQDLHLHGEQLTFDTTALINFQKNIMVSKIEKADLEIFIDPSLDQLVSMVEMVGSMNQLTMTDSKLNFRISGPISNVSKWRVTSL